MCCFIAKLRRFGSDAKSFSDCAVANIFCRQQPCDCTNFKNKTVAIISFFDHFRSQSVTAVLWIAFNGD